MYAIRHPHPHPFRRKHLPDRDIREASFTIVFAMPR